MEVVASTDCELLSDARAAGRQSDSISRAMNNFIWNHLANIGAQEYRFYLKPENGIPLFHLRLVALHLSWLEPGDQSFNNKGDCGLNEF